MRILLLPAFTLLSAATAIAQTRPAYTITDLGSVPGTTYCFADAINQLGQVAGSCSVVFNGLPTGFLWTSGTLQSLAAFVPSAVNSHGDVVGGTLYAAPVLWKNGQLYNLYNGSGGAKAINEAGEISGFISGNGDQSVVWHGGKAKLLPVPAGTTSSEAHGINCCGMIVGYTSDTATLWQNGTATALPPLTGDLGSVANGINDRGIAVGASATTLNSEAVSQAVFWVNGIATSLGPAPSGKETFGYGINNRNQAVGVIGIYRGLGSTQAFLFSQGVMYDLDSLIPANSGWQINTAYSINDSGQIAASGIHNGKYAAAILTPQ